MKRESEESAMDVDPTPPTPGPPVQIDLEESEGQDGYVERREIREEEKRRKRGQKRDGIF
jgi:hypothetical protein